MNTLPCCGSYGETLQRVRDLSEGRLRHEPGFVYVPPVDTNPPAIQKSFFGEDGRPARDVLLAAPPKERADPRAPAKNGFVKVGERLRHVESGLVLEVLARDVYQRFECQWVESKELETLRLPTLRDQFVAA